MNGKTVISYTIVFDDEAQQKNFYKLIKKLREIENNEGTIAYRLNKFIENWLKNNG